jgi:hypothetical protein
VVAALRTALSVTARPGRGVDAEDERPAPWSGISEQAPQPVPGDTAASQRLLEAAVAAGEHRLEAELAQQRDRTRAADDPIGELEEGITPGVQAGSQASAELDELTTVAVSCVNLAGGHQIRQ